MELFRTQRMQLFYQHNTRGSILGGWFLLAASGAMFFNVVLSMIQVFYYSTLQRATLGDFYAWQVPDALAFLPVGIIAGIVQTYFALRVYHVSVNQPLRSITIDFDFVTSFSARAASG